MDFYVSKEIFIGNRKVGKCLCFGLKARSHLTLNVTTADRTIAMRRNRKVPQSNLRKKSIFVLLLLSKLDE